MNKRTALLLALLALLAVVALTYPAFINHYYDECISQNLAPTCYRLQWPSFDVWLYYLIH